MRYLKPLILLILLAGFWGAPSFQAQAQKKNPFLTGEDVAIAFFKTAGKMPNFDSWVKFNPEYKIIAPANVPEFTVTEKQRLLNRWKDYDQTEGTLNVRTYVTADAEAATDTQGRSTYSLHIRFYDGDVDYFPYIYGDYKFALFPKNLKKLFSQTISQQQFELFQTHLRKNEGVFLDLVLKPVKAHVDQPYEIDGVEQWALLADVAAISLTTKNRGILLWTYNAGGYIAPEKRELLKLYGP